MAPSGVAEQFLVAWRAAAAEWVAASRQDPARGREVLVRLLEDGLPASSSSAGDLDPENPENAGATDDQVMLCEIELISLSGALDVSGYLSIRPAAAEDAHGPVAHFCRQGWQSLANPNLDFDVWWYLTEHLDPADLRINPLLHHLLVGARDGLRTLPRRQSLAPATALPGDREVRRACLVAGFDVDGVVDDYVVDLVRELDRFADVYYLADSVLPAGELGKLAPYTAGAWAAPHGRRDAGSYALLAGDLVGWQRLEQYDEVVFANDSAYLTGPLDQVFEVMSGRAADWWGVQLRPGRATVATAEPALPLEDFLGTVPHAVWHYDQFPRISYHFFAVRGRVLADPGFRRRVESVATQRVRHSYVTKYETGLTFHLLGEGFELATYLDTVDARDPLFTPEAFPLLGERLPLLKRTFLVDNPDNAPDLVEWKARVLEQAPQAPVEMLERNLLRVGADDRLRRSFAIRTRDDGRVVVPKAFTRPRMEVLDARTPTYDHWWAFPVCAYDHTLSGNERAVFEEVRDDPSIKKIVLTRSRRVEVTGENVVVLPLTSPEGQHHVLRARQIFVKHAARTNVPYPISRTAHNFINLWHGIPLKRFGWAAYDPAGVGKPPMDHLVSTAVITSSKIDTLAMTAAFYPMTIQQMWPTGLPRNDFILRDEELMPADLREEERVLRDEVAGRRLVMFLPTFKDGQADSYYTFSDQEIEWLRDWCARTGTVIGVREHMADRAHTYSRMLAPLEPINLSSRRFPTLEVLYRVAAGLVTDYSSCLVDFLTTGRPVVSFAYDYDRYANEERGLFYDLDAVVPGPVCRDFGQFADALDEMFEERTPEQREDYAWKRATFFDHLDDSNAARVVERVKRLYVNAL